MRSFLARFAGSLLVLGLVACGDSGGDGTGTDGSGGSTTTQSGTTGSMTGSTTGSTNASTGSNMGDPEPPEQTGMTAAHNLARANVSPPASTPIPPLSWDSELAAVAQAYAEQCIFEHSMGQYGENLYAESGLGSGPADVVKAWVDEAQFYDYDTGACSSPPCGHYTQVVWADSLRLGCGVAQCDTNSPFGSGAWVHWVCEYDPPGNWVGEQPY
jgi:uncharacterized protein YkwD